MSLFRCFLAALHAMHTFFPMTYIYVRDLYNFIYKTYKMVCIVCMVCRVVCTNDGTRK